MKIPFKHETREFTEEDLRGIQNRNLRGELTEVDRESLDALLSFVILGNFFNRKSN